MRGVSTPRSLECRSNAAYVSKNNNTHFYWGRVYTTANTHFERIMMSDTCDQFSVIATVTWSNAVRDRKATFGTSWKQEASGKDADGNSNEF